MRAISRLLASFLSIVVGAAALADTQQASIVERSSIEYPPSARRLGHQGTVTVSVEVLADGSVGATEVATSSGSPTLDEAGMNGVRRWRFAPASQDGSPSASVIAVPVEFTLTETGPSGQTSTPEATPNTEAGRLGRIWIAYRRHKGFNQEIFDKCQAIGVDTAQARAMNQKFDAKAEAQFAVLEGRLKQALAANGSPDPEAHIRNTGQELEVDTKIRFAELFDKVDAAEQKRKCDNSMLNLSSVEGSFAFSDYYERLMAL